jgi:hypothetical protein
MGNPESHIIWPCNPVATDRDWSRESWSESLDRHGKSWTQQPSFTKQEEAWREKRDRKAKPEPALEFDGHQ